MKIFDKRGNNYRFFKKSLILAIILIMAFLFGYPVFAQSYVEDFEDLNLGTILGQDNWDCDPAVNCALVIATTTVHSGAQCLYSSYPDANFPTKARKTTIEERSTGRLSFWAYPLSNDRTVFKLNSDDDLLNENNTVDFKLENNNLYLRIGVATFQTLATGFDLNQWNEVSVEWNVSTQELRGKIDDSGWSAWYSDYQQDFTNIVNFAIRARGTNAETYIDDIQYGEGWAELPEIDPTYPEIGTTTEIAVGDFNTSGDYWYSPFDVEWFSLSVIFTSTSTGAEYFFTTDISASSSGSYSIPVQIFDSGVYLVTYTLLGNSWEDCLFLPCYPQIVIFEPDNLATTTVVIGESGLPTWVEIPVIDFYEEEEPAAGTVQHFLWSIKNFFKNLILPTQQAQSSFLDKVSAIKTKFPYNYISVIKTFMTSSTDDIVDDPTISFSMFDATGTATMGFSNANITIGSETKKFSEWIVIISSLFLLAGFLIYIISFIRRIL